MQLTVIPGYRNGPVEDLQTGEDQLRYDGIILKIVRIKIIETSASTSQDILCIRILPICKSIQFFINKAVFLVVIGYFTCIQIVFTPAIICS